METQHIEICVYNARAKRLDYIVREVSERNPKKIEYTDAEEVFILKKLLLGYRYFGITEEGALKDITAWTYFKEALDNCREKGYVCPTLAKNDNLV